MAAFDPTCALNIWIIKMKIAVKTNTTLQHQSPLERRGEWVKLQVWIRNKHKKISVWLVPGVSELSSVWWAFCEPTADLKGSVLLLMWTHIQRRVLARVDLHIWLTKANFSCTEACAFNLVGFLHAAFYRHCGVYEHSCCVLTSVWAVTLGL